jgi:hypothetical protein
MTAKWRKLVALTPTEQRLLLQAFGLAWIVRLQLWLFPFALTRRVTASWARVPNSSHPAMDAEAVCRAVTRSARYVPGATCLTQALTGWILLSRHGIDSAVRYGVMPDGKGCIMAHAWIETPGVAPGQPPRVLLGGETAPRRFVALQ